MPNRAKQLKEHRKAELDLKMGRKNWRFKRALGFSQHENLIHLKYEGYEYIELN